MVLSPSQQRDHKSSPNMSAIEEEHSAKRSFQHQESMDANESLSPDRLLNETCPFVSAFERSSRQRPCLIGEVRARSSADLVPSLALRGERTLAVACIIQIQPPGCSSVIMARPPSSLVHYLYTKLRRQQTLRIYHELPPIPRDTFAPHSTQRAIYRWAAALIVPTTIAFLTSR